MDRQAVRVLLVDDDRDDYLLTRELFTEMNGHRYTLDWVADYDAGLAATCRGEHDVYLLDYRLGRRNGLELLREVQQRNCKGAAIILTGQGERDIDVEAMKAGAADYLDKGRLDAARLERSIRYALQHKQHEEALEKRIAERTAELVSANAALRESEAFNRSVLEGSPDCVKVLDDGGRLLSMNKNGQCLLEIDDVTSMLGRNWWELWPEEAKRDLLQSLEAARAHGTGRFQGYCPTAKGTPKWWDVMVAPIRDANGKVVRFVSVSRDITERQRAEDALRASEIREREAADELRRLAASLSAADRHKNEFLAMLAHELRNPLAAIRNATELLRVAEGNRDAVQSAAQILQRQSGQMIRLVDDLLDVSRLSQGKVTLRKEQVELAAIVNHAVEAARPLIESMGHQLVINLPPQPIHLNADPARLAQVVGNLLNNACKFSDRNGRILLTVERDDAHAVIRVRDHGIGIAPESLSRIFEIFVQVESSLARSTSGLGLGLTLVKNLVAMHGGTVNAFSAGAGQGSEFVVRLPIEAAIDHNA